jgi:Amidohydrolase family
MTTHTTKIVPDTLKAYRQLESQGRLTLRLAYNRRELFGELKDPETEMSQFKNAVGSGDDMIWVVAVSPSAVDGATTRACTNQKRISAYGTLESYWPVGQCYTDREWRGAAGKGAPIEGDYFRDWFMAAGRQGVRQATIHVAGDRSVKNLLDLIEEIQKRYGPASTKNWAFDHCFMVDPSDLPRAARLRVTFSCAPKYIEGAEGVAKAYGETVANTFIVPVKSMLDAGDKVVFEEDRDTFVWHDLSILMTRKDKAGEVWGPQDRVDHATALKMATRWVAEYVLKPDKLGSIEAGKLADLVVLDQDYMTIPDEEVNDIRPQLTMLDGKIIFVNTKFSKENNLRPIGAILSTYEELKSRRPAK